MAVTISTAEQYLWHLARQVGSAFVFTAAASLLSSGWPAGHLTDVPVLQRAAMAGVAAGLMLLKGVLAKAVGDTNSPNLVVGAGSASDPATKGGAGLSGVR